MKKLLKLIFTILPLIVFSQDTLQISTEAKEIAATIEQKKKSIDSIKFLKNKEIQKQLRIIALIKEEIRKKEVEKKLRHFDKSIVVKVFDSIEALKPNNEPEYWEAIPRKWTGRLFHKEDYRIRKYKFINNEKVYLD